MADNTENNIVQQVGGTRVLYVEPNDIYGTADKVPITPTYEDFCIGFNLVVRGVKRYQPNFVRKSGGNINTDNDGNYWYELSWTSKLGETVGDGVSQVSFQQGNGDTNSQTFLTTYYADIDFTTVNKKQIVEGLGVESIAVSFENFYVPTAVIKFVDVRGSSLFGREEAIHKDGELTADNIFGCFMTFPFPEFKLQIKGFYGKPVTYQLMMSSFQGSFNANNGNFEITTKFIGYSYSLLTDIPLTYLIAAPYCNYEGKAYWNSRKSSSDWAMEKGEEPPTLFDFIHKIDSTISELGDENKLSDEDSEATKSYENENASLNNIQSLLNKYINELKSFCTAYIYTNNSEDVVSSHKDWYQFLAMFDSVYNEEQKTVKLVEVKNAYNNLVRALSDHNEQYTSNKIDSNGIFKTEYKTQANYITTKDLINIETDNGGKITNITLNGYSKKDIQTIKGIKMNYQKPLYTVAKELNKRISEPYENGNVARYCHVFNIGEIEQHILERRTQIEKEQAAIVKRVAVDMEERLKNTLPVIPHIGNIFKIIMCHLETLCYIISRSITDIENSDRTPSTLGIDLSATDALNIDTVPPWPGLYNRGKKTSNGGIETEDSILKAWPGDFKHGVFVEEDVINALKDSAMFITSSENNGQSNTTTMSAFPVLPCDLNSTNSPFYNIQQGIDISSLGGYLGIRLTQIFGVMFNGKTPSNTLIETIAKMDAYNFYIACGSKVSLENNIINVVQNGSISDALKNIMLCNESGDIYADTYEETNKKSHKFENNVKLRSIYNSNDRCPIVVSNNNNYEFVRYYTNSDISIVPSRLDDWSEYKEIFPYTGSSSDAYFSPQYDNTATSSHIAKEFLHVCNAEQIIDDAENNLEYYVNNDLFNVITSEDDVQAIEAKYETLKNNTVNLPDYTTETDFSTILEKVWLVGEDKYSEYYKNSLYVVTRNKEKLGINDNILLGDDRSTVPTTLKNIDWFNKGKSCCITYKEDGTLTTSSTTTSDDGTTNDKTEEVSESELAVHQSIIMQDDGLLYSLFGSVFYYMQNKKLSSETNDNSKWNDRRTKVKCLLFLCTLNYNMGKIPSFLNGDKECGTIEKVPYGYLLLLGGLLWRQRYYEQHDKTDPIISEEGSIKFKNSIVKTQIAYKASTGYFMKVYNNQTNYCLTLKDIIGGSNDSELEIDYHVENKLIKLFEAFALGTFGQIKAKCEIQARNGNTVSEFTGITFNSFLKDFASEVYSSGKTVNDGLKLIENRTSGVFGQYSYIYVNNSNNLACKLLLREDNITQELIKSLYFQKCIVIDTGRKKLNKNSAESITQATTPQSCANAYIEAFAKYIEAIVDSESTTVVETKEGEDEKSNDERDISISMYYYIKNLYDKWLLPAYADSFNVEVFFKNNFVFIDKFYLNTYDKVMINCEILSELYHSALTSEGKSLYSFISDIVGRHRCLFVALPDYIDFGESDGDRIDAMKKLFKPLSFNEGMTWPRPHNHFVTIFVGDNAEKAADTNNYVKDSFDINNADTIPSSFKAAPTGTVDGGDTYTRYGYNVPSFGVAFARQNQNIFKNISVSMENPTETDISIAAYNNIAQKGSSNAGGILYYGQDIYNIYSQYAYECEVEMMGDAQIQPLMYFQLLNVPMWCGAYMIFNVTHTMTPGNMVTKFKGQKMSKYNYAYPSSYCSERKPMEGMDAISNSGDGSMASISQEVDYTLPDSYESAPSDTSCNYEVLKSHLSSGDSPKLQLNGTWLDSRTCTLLCKLIEEIKLLPENKTTETWSILISSAVRDSGSKSQHNYLNGALAVDIQIATVKNGVIQQPRIKDASKIFTVMDILATNHLSEIGQLIFEGASGASPVKGDGSYQSSYTCLHLSHRGSRSNPMIFLSEASSGKNLANSYSVSTLDTNVPAGYKAIAKKHYIAATTETQFKNIFCYYQKFSPSELSTHFGTERSLTPTASCVSC